MKKGRHRRFEEARKLKQMGPDFLFSEPAPPVVHEKPDDEVDDEYAEIAARYGAFDDEDDDTESDDDDHL